MGYTIVSGNKTSSVALHQSLNVKMPKIKWDDAEKPTINHFYKIDDKKFAL